MEGVEGLAKVDWSEGSTKRKTVVSSASIFTWLSSVSSYQHTIRPDMYWLKLGDNPVYNGNWIYVLDLEYHWLQNNQKKQRNKILIKCVSYLKIGWAT